MPTESKGRSNIFVALLRGINVGGKNLIRMSSLKETFEELGFADVSTYINSGNVFFKSKESDPRKLEQKIEQALARKHKLDRRVVVRSLSEISELVKNLPRDWDGDKAWRYNVIFLRHSIDSQDVLRDLSAKPDIERVVYRPGTLLWSAKASDITHTRMHKLSSLKIFQDMTVRNTNTTRKLYELMKKMADASE